jgi:hypothetical protein
MRYTWIHAINEPRNFSQLKVKQQAYAEMQENMSELITFYSLIRFDDDWFDKAGNYLLIPATY